MGKLLLAGVGGFIGSALRYSVGVLTLQFGRGARFPLGTLTVNLVGCVTIGFLSQIVETRGWFAPDVRVLIFVGLLGGFTTFSAFGHETINLWRAGDGFLAGLNVAAHLVLCLGAVWLSRVLAYQILGG